MQGRNRARVGLGVAAAAAMVAATTWIATPAMAQPVSATDTLDVEVEVADALTIEVQDDPLVLSGAPGDPVTDNVTFTAYTNWAEGYTVSVAPDTESLLDADEEEVEDFPFSLIEVEQINVGTPGDFVPLAFGAPVPVFETTAASAAIAGETADHDYQLEIPAVPAGSYTGTITYTASANP